MASLRTSNRRLRNEKPNSSATVPYPTALIHTMLVIKRAIEASNRDFCKRVRDLMLKSFERAYISNRR